MALDPTHDEMLTGLQKVYAGLIEDIDDDAEVAIYWFANDWHGGQATNLYSALSTSPYSPGPISTLQSEGETVGMMYDELVAAYGHVDVAGETLD